MMPASWLDLSGCPCKSLTDAAPNCQRLGSLILANQFNFHTMVDMHRLDKGALLVLSLLFLDFSWPGLESGPTLLQIGVCRGWHLYRVWIGDGP